MTLDEFLRQFGSALDQGLSPVGLLVVMLAGIVASAVCPCTLPVGLGIASAAGASEAESRHTGLGISLAFFAGIVLNLTLLGALTGRLGALATERFGLYWALGMALLSLLAALFAFWGPGLPVRQLTGWRRPGLTGAFGYGFIFSFGTSVAPLLLLLTVSAATGSPLYGMLLAFTFGIGRGLPFLIAGIAASTLTDLTHLAAWNRPLRLFSGVVLLLVSGYYAKTFVALL